MGMGRIVASLISNVQWAACVWIVSADPLKFNHRPFASNRGVVRQTDAANCRGTAASLLQMRRVEYPKCVNWMVAAVYLMDFVRHRTKQLAENCVRVNDPDSSAGPSGPMGVCSEPVVITPIATVGAPSSVNSMAAVPHSRALAL